VTSIGAEKFPTEKIAYLLSCAIGIVIGNIIGNAALKATIEIQKLFYCAFGIVIGTLVGEIFQIISLGIQDSSFIKQGCYLSCAMGALIGTIIIERTHNIVRSSAWDKATIMCTYLGEKRMAIVQRYLSGK